MSQSIDYGRSAPGVAVGLVLLIIGQVLFDLGRQAALESALSSSLYSSGSDGGPLMIIGAIVALVGLVTLVRSVFILASNVDLAAEFAARHWKAKRITGSVVEQLDELKSQYRRGQITEQQYDEARAELLRDV